MKKLVFLLLFCSVPVHAEMDWDVLQVHMEDYFNQVVDAIYIAEGGERARKAFGILSVDCNGYAECRRVCYNTVRNNYKRYIQAGRKGDFIVFLGSKYCPVGASNDPLGLNKNWISNVNSIMERL